MLYESLKEVGREDEMTAQNGKLYSARQIFKIFIPAIGAFITKDLLESQFQILISFNVVAAFAAIIILMLLREPKRERQVLKQEIGLFKESLQTIRYCPWLLRASLNKSFVFIAIFLAWRIYQPFLTDHGISVEILGLFYIITEGTIFLSRWFLGDLVKKIGEARIISLSAIVVAISLLVAIISQTPWVLCVALVATLAIGPIRTPVFAEAMNNRIESHVRATTLSNLNVIKSFLDIPFLLLAGYFATHDLRYTLMIGLALALVSIVFLPIRQRDLDVHKTP